MGSRSIVVKEAVLRADDPGRREGLRYTAAIWVLAIVQAAGLVLLIERPAHAYVDPGSGFLAFQMVGASLAGAAFVLRRKLRRLLRRDRGKLQLEASPARVAPSASDGKRDNPIVS